jgi:hypothetical protein
MWDKAVDFFHQVAKEEGWSIKYGGAGLIADLTGGKEFTFANANYNLIAIRGKATHLLTQLQLLFVDIHTGQFQESLLVGNDTGMPFTWQCPPGQWISKIHLFTGSKIDSIQVETNLGLQSPKFGGNGGGHRQV